LVDTKRNRRQVPPKHKLTIGARMLRKIYFQGGKDYEYGSTAQHDSS